MTVESSTQQPLDVEMIWLAVPFAQKDTMKAIGGARWNQDKKSWYLPDGIDPAPFAAWVQEAEPPAPVIQPEFAACDRPGASLFIDLVPKTAWYSNLRSLLTADEWTRVGKAAFRRAHWCCEVCGGRGPQWPVEAHERWIFGKDGVQRLTDVIALCPDCHEATHAGLAEVKGRLPEALAHFAKVNMVTAAAARMSFVQAVEVWNTRSTKQWTFDASHLLLIARDLLDPASVTRIEAMLKGQGRPPVKSSRG